MRDGPLATCDCDCEVTCDCVGTCGDAEVSGTLIHSPVVLDLSLDSGGSEWVTNGTTLQNRDLSHHLRLRLRWGLWQPEQQDPKRLVRVPQFAFPAAGACATAVAESDAVVVLVSTALVAPRVECATGLMVKASCN